MTEKIKRSRNQVAQENIFFSIIFGCCDEGIKQKTDKWHDLKKSAAFMLLGETNWSKYASVLATHTQNFSLTIIAAQIITDFGLGHCMELALA